MVPHGRILGTPGNPDEGLPPELQAMLAKAKPLQSQQQPDVCWLVEELPIVFPGTGVKDGVATVVFDVPTGPMAKKQIQIPFGNLEALKAFGEAVLDLYEKCTAALYDENVEVAPPADDPADSARGNPSEAQVEALLGE